jgi:hypothetical protein
MSLLLLSSLSYEDDQIVIPQLKYWGYTKIDTFSFNSPLLNYDTNGFIASNYDHVIIAFRGTETTQVVDWITDMDYSFVDTATGEPATYPKCTDRSVVKNSLLSRIYVFEWNLRTVPSRIL